jgi:2-isopropylmalate synthase
VYTAFSGSHQDAIKKGMDAQERSGTDVWDVPYLSIDPKDVGRSYEAIIRVNSQSGKGGVAYLMATEHQLELPRGLQVDFAQRVQQITDGRGGELTAEELMAAFQESYLDHSLPYGLLAYTHSSEEETDQIAARVTVDGEERVIEGEGNGPIAALVDAFDRAFGVRISIRDYHEHAMAARADAKAAAYVEADVDEEAFWGVGVHGSILTASLRAIVSAVNRSVAARQAAEAAAEAFESA